MVDIVLATDMSQHFQQMSQINDALNNPKELDKVKVMALIVHVADISHAAKDWSLHERYFKIRACSVAPTPIDPFAPLLCNQIKKRFWLTDNFETSRKPTRNRIFA